MERLKNKYVVFFFMINFIVTSRAQFLPKDDAKLNYNQIYFEYPYNENAKFYKLFLAVDSSNNKTNFKTCLYNTFIDKTPATRINELEFGKKYKWYIETNLKSGEKINSDIHYFSILKTHYTDTAQFKRKINYNKKSKINEGVIWCDFSHCAFDRKGNVVWFIPTEIMDYNEKRRIRDFKFQNDGTITFIKNPEALHTTVDIKTIWKAPLGGENNYAYRDGYHHNFEKLPNGNYMALAYDYVELEKADKIDTLTNRVELVNLIEFDKNGKIVWIWEMRNHFPLDILEKPKGADGRAIINAHCNAFSIDKESKYIYIGYRDISRVIKIEKLTKKIVASYGKKLNKADSLVNETDIFNFPHNARILNDNQIMILNNNDSRNGKISSVEIFKQPKKITDKINSSWSFKFDFDSLNSGKSLKLGNIKILDNGHFLINQGSNNRIVEITKNKEILWDMMIYRKDSTLNKWVDFGSYKIDYSTSLYPFYFSVAGGKSSNEKSYFIIFNEGDYIDSYEFEIVSLVVNKIITNGITQEIKIGEKIKYYFLTQTSTSYKLKVTSKTSGKSKFINL